MKTHDLGRAFYVRVNVIKGTPLVHVTKTHQARWPFWWGPSILVRLPHGQALMLGWWFRAPRGLDEEQLLIRSIGGRVVEDQRSDEVQRAVLVRTLSAEEAVREMAQG